MIRAMVRGGKHYCRACRIANGEGLVHLTCTDTNENGKRIEVYTCPICRLEHVCDHLDDATS